jgi:putative transposase
MTFQSIGDKQAPCHISKARIPGLLQHVIVRGIERYDIIHDDEDRSHFLERFTSLLIATETRCFAWSLMSNHFHLLLKPRVRRTGQA